jgi:ParB-like chromosome segregation protein Spo0J
MNDLLAVEAVLRQLASSMKCSKPQAARAIRRLDNERRGHVQATTGRERAREITALVNAAGFTVREFVSRKLPLLALPDELRDLVRRGSLAPTKALALARVEDELEREALTKRTLLEKLSVKAIRGASNTPVSPPLSSSVADEYRWLSLEATRALGTRVEIDAERVVIHHDGGEGLSVLLEQLGIEV